MEEWPPKDVLQPGIQGDRFFREGEKLREKYNDVELDNFMKLLGIKPKVQWEDQSTYHYKLGVHNYEDESQELDPDFHILSESERIHADRIKTREWRRGSEVKLVADGRKPILPVNRF